MDIINHDIFFLFPHSFPTVQMDVDCARLRWSLPETITPFPQWCWPACWTSTDQGKNKPFCHLTCLIHFDPQLLTTTHQHFVAANDKNWLDRISSVCISTLSNMMDAITVENVQHKKKWENLSSQSCLIFRQHGAAPSLPSLPSHLPSLILYQVSKGKYH